MMSPFECSRSEMVITLNDVDKGNRCRIAEYHGSFEGSTQQGYRWKVEPKPYLN